MTWTISRRIFAAFTFVLTLMLLLAIVGVSALRSATQAYQAAEGEERVVLIAGLEAESESREMNLQYLRYLLSADEAFLRARDSTAVLTRRDLDALVAATAGHEGEAHWREAVRLMDAWERASQESIVAARQGDVTAAQRLWNEAVMPLRLQMRGAIDDGLESARRRSADTMAAAGRSAQRMERLLFLGALIALLVGVGSGLVLDRAVGGALRETTGVLASSAAEILAATSQQASTVSETSAAVVETSTTVDEVTQTSEQAAERARTLANSAKHAAEIGSRGRRAVEDTVEAVGGVKEQVESIAGSILVLAEQAQSIGEIIATVKDLADQTNLLALNAAVEAARAGEQGRGFAVVAGEIRTLADESKRATVQVRDILGEVQRATSSAVMTTERGTQQVAAVAAQVGDAGDTIRLLEEAVADAAQAAAQIVASAGQQAVGMGQIRQAMGNIQDATHQSLSSTRQTEQAASDLNQLGKRLLAMVGGRSVANGDGPA